MTMEYGFTHLQHLAEESASDHVEVINQAIVETFEAWNEVATDMRSSITKTYTKPTTAYNIPTERRMQPLDESGNPRPRSVGEQIKAGFPIRDYGDAFGTHRKSRAKLTVQNYNDEVSSIVAGDHLTMIDEMMRVILAKDNWTFDDTEHDDILVRALANGDTQQYAKRSGIATANHYLGQANAISDTAGDNPYITGRDLLRSYRSNGTKPIIAYIPTALRTVTQNLVDFGAAADLTRTTPSDVNPIDVHFDATLLGATDGVYIAEWGDLPDDYIFFHVEGTKLFGWREEPEASLRGLIYETHSPDGNHKEDRWLRSFGLGALNRIGGAVIQIGAGSYATPAGYTVAPLG